jgi:hypothetical protein
VEEAFGCCLGTVLARAHIDTYHSFQPVSCYNAADSLLDAGKEDWEHVDLFHEPFHPDTQPARAAVPAGAKPAPLARSPVLLSEADPASSSPAITQAHEPEQLAPATLADADAARMATLFLRLRRRLERLRRYNRTARHREAREQAAAILGAAAAGGCQRIAGRAARLLGWTGYLTAAVLDDLELQIDTAEAVWDSCRSVV